MSLQEKKDKSAIDDSAFESLEKDFQDVSLILGQWMSCVKAKPNGELVY